jgi:hypothetical protein
LLDQLLHGFDVLGAGLLAPYGALAHGMTRSGA